MGKAGLIAGKLLQGVADVAVPAALAEQAADIQAKRDQRLQGYAEKNQGAQFTHQRDLQDDRQEFQSGQQEDQQTFLMRLEKMKKPEREARLNLLKKQLTNEGLQTQVTNLALGGAKAKSALLEGLQSPELTPRQRKDLLETYFLYEPDARPKTTIKQLRDEAGMYLDDFAIFEGSSRVDNAAAGGGAWYMKEGGVSNAREYQRAVGEIRDSFQRGEISKAAAAGQIAYLDAMLGAQSPGQAGRNR